jgi:ATP-dependent RNA helicase DOB1
MEEEVKELRKRLGDEEGISQYTHLLEQIENERDRIRSFLLLPENLDKYFAFLKYGRLVFVKANKPGEVPWGWCMIASKEIRLPNTSDGKKKKRKFDDSPIFVEVIAYALSSSLGQIKNDSPPDVVWNASVNAKPSTNDDDGQWTSLRIAPSLISHVSSVKLNEKKIGSQIKTQQQRNSVGAAINSTIKYLGGNLPVLSPTDMDITSEAVESCVANLAKFDNELRHSKFLTVNEIERTAQLHLWDEKKVLEIQLAKKKEELHSALQDVSLLTTLKHMQAVLRKLEHTTTSDVIDVKGRVAAEISTGDELVATELIFTGVFADLSVAQCVSLCSCLVFNERAGDEPLRLPPELQQPLNKLQDIARRIANTMKECRLPIETDEYVDRFQPTLMQAVYAWCTGAKFIEVCKVANNVFEGSIIRCLRRLEELLRQLAAASNSIGNSTLEEKFTAGINLLKRDIVFAASLYL